MIFRGEVSSIQSLWLLVKYFRLKFILALGGFFFRLVSFGVVWCRLLSLLTSDLFLFRSGAAPPRSDPVIFERFCLSPSWLARLRLRQGGARNQLRPRLIAAWH